MTQTLTKEPGVEEQLRVVIEKVWRENPTVSSTLCRENAALIAMAASQHLITSHIGGQLYGGAWHITTKGLSWLKQTEED